MPRYFCILILAGYLISPAGLFAQNNNWEYRFMRKLEAKRTDAGIRFNKNLSVANNWICLAVPAVMFGKGLWENDKPAMQKAAIVTGSMVISTILTQGIKRTVDRPRPAAADSSFTAALNLSRHSFPSGHTSIAFSMATALTLTCPKWYVAVPAFGYAALAGWSRLYLGVHYPTDVLAGALLGSGSSWLAVRANNWLQQKKEHKKKLAFY